MPIFVIRCLDKSDMSEARAANRQAHRDHLAKAGDALRAAGPLEDDEGKVIGSMITLELPDRAAAEAFVATDPFKQAGIFASVELTRWRVSFGGLVGPAGQ